MTTLSRRATRHVEVTVVTGLSGAGRSEVAKALEDLGWFVVDNIPPTLIRTMIKLALAPGNELKRIALVIDARGGAFFDEALEELRKIRRDITNYRLLFLEASDDVLVRRFDATRRKHPLAQEDPVAVGIQRERQLMAPLRDGADLIVDTSDLSVRALRAKVGAYFADVGPADVLKTTVISFGYKFGIPLDADIVLDVRFLPNPHWIDDLRPLDGREDPVRDFVLEKEVTQDFLARTRDLLAVLLPGYQAEGRHYLTIAIGCTGGRHRSVVLAAEVADLARENGFVVNVIHRDVHRGDTAA